MTNQGDEERAQAEKLLETLTACANCDTDHAYKPGNEQCHEITHIMDAFEEIRRAERVRTLENCAEIINENYSVLDSWYKLIKKKWEEIHWVNKAESELMHLTWNARASCLQFKEYLSRAKENHIADAGKMV